MELVYFIDSIRQVDVPYAEFNRAVGYNANYVPRGLNVLNEDRSSKGLEVYRMDILRAVYTDVTAALDAGEPLDLVTTAIARREQSTLRRILFGSEKLNECGICGRRLPTNLLIASHIKRRSDATDEEKADVHHIAMPMCNLGCDALYAQGYVAVRNGAVRATHP